MFGLSIPHTLSDCAGAIRRLDPSLMPYLELQGDLISDRKVLEAVVDKKLYLNSYDYIKSSTITNSLEQTDTFQEELLSTIEILISDKIHSNLDNITIDFGLFRNPESERVPSFLRKLYYKILQSNKNICLPVTLPGMEESLTAIQTVFYKLMLNRFRVSLNIYPHEIKKDDDFSNFISDLEFRIEFIRICYDAGSGNYITDKLLNHWLEIFKRCDINSPIIFVPSVGSVEMLEQEVSNICNLIRPETCRNL